MPRLQLADGQRLAYHDIGSRAPNAPTLVLLHGFGMRAAFWIPLLAGLTKDTRVVLPDFRGFGNSHGTHYSQADVLSQSADDLQLLLDALQLKQVALAGLSMGACVSMRYFERHGHQRVSRYLNIDQAPCVSNQPDWQWGLFGTQQTRRYGEFRALLAAVEHSGAPSDYRALPWRLRRQANSAFSKFSVPRFFCPATAGACRPACEFRASPSNCCRAATGWPICTACAPTWSRTTIFAPGWHSSMCSGLASGTRVATSPLYLSVTSRSVFGVCGRLAR